MDKRLLEEWSSIVATEVCRQDYAGHVKVNALGAAALVDAIICAVEKHADSDLLRRALSAEADRADKA